MIFSHHTFARLFLLSGFASVAVLAAEPLRPNIVFILADDLGYGDVACYGQTKIPTPNIDRLAKEGMRFTQAYAGGAICSPSRCALMTGLHTGHTRIRGNMADEGGLPGLKGETVLRRMNLMPEDRTIGDVLRPAGYRTAVVGKWHLDGFNPGAGPMDRSFDEFHGWLISAPLTYSSTYFPAGRMHNRELVEVPQNLKGATVKYEPDMCIEEASAFLESNRDRPFFLYLALNLPHSPYQAPRFGQFADKDWPEPMKHYAFMVNYADDIVGRIMAKLKELGLDERTLVVFTSDNGPRSEPQPMQTKIVEFFDSNGPLRGYKRDLSEGGIREPMIVRWPGRVPASTTSDTAWSFVDVMPTLAELAGAKAPEHIDGVSVVPTLLGQPQDLSQRFMYWEDVEGPFEQAVRWGKWKAFRRGLTGSIELYDLPNDIAEANDVAAQNPGVVARVRDFLATARVDSPEYHIHP